MQTMTDQPQYQITDADKRRVAQIAYAWKAYEGELEPPLVPMDDAPDDNVLANYIEDKIEAGKDFLFGKEVEISVEDGVAQDVQDFLNTTWGEKETKIPLLQELYINGALAGQAFLRIVPHSDGSFRLVALDPRSVYVRTAPQDCKTALLFCIEYCEEELIDGKMQSVYYREEIVRIAPNQDGDGKALADKDAIWSIQHWTRIGEKGAWSAAGEPIPWPYSFPPIFSNQHSVRPNSFWGKPKVTKNLIHLNEALNVSNSNIQKLGRLTSHPIIAATGTGLMDVDHTPGRITVLPTADGKIFAVDIAADLSSLQASADRLQSRIDEQTGVPGIATGRASAMPGGNMSGIAIELLFMSMIKRMDTERCLYGELILDVSRALLILNNMSGDIKLTLQWQSPLPADDTGSAQAALLKKQLGVSDATLLSEMGYNPEEELEKNQTEDEQKLINFSRGQGFPPPQPGQLQEPSNEGA